MAVIYGTNGNNTLRGTSGVDYLYGYGGNDYLYGYSGNDRLYGGPGIDTMYGGLGNDWYFVDRYSDSTIETSGSGGYDTVYSTISRALGNNLEKLVLRGTATINGKGNSLNNQIIGNSAKNHLYGYGGNDYISGGGGNDRLYGGTGIDTMVGGTGNDWYFVDRYSDITKETSAGGGYDTIYSTVSRTLDTYEEKLVLMGAAAINGKGTWRDNYIKGNAADNYLYGYGGNDTLNGGAGRDVMHGGTGNDTYFVDTSTDITHETSATNGNDTIISMVSRTLGSFEENLVLQGDTDINGYGNSLINNITGNGGDNILYGYEGNDIIDGGLGRDTMYGGPGNDRYYVDSSGDSVIETSSADGYDTVYTTEHITTLYDHIERLYILENVWQGRGNDLDNHIYGNSRDNYLYGFDGSDHLYGFEGNDTIWADTFNDYGDDHIFGGSGDDSLIGGYGNDILDGGVGVDRMYGEQGNDIYYVDNTSDVIGRETDGYGGGYEIVYSTVDYTLVDGLEKLVLQGTAYEGGGNSLDNDILGNSVNNYLRGEAGNDTLGGGLAQDYLRGGTGADKFVFDTALESTNPRYPINWDTIYDFNYTEGDQIVLDQTIFTNLSTGMLSSDYFRSSSGGTAADSNDYILYNTTSGALFYDADGNGSGTAVQFALLSNKPSLIASDFNVIA